MRIYETIEYWNGKKLDWTDRVLLRALHDITALEQRVRSKFHAVQRREEDVLLCYGLTEVLGRPD